MLLNNNLLQTENLTLQFNYTEAEYVSAVQSYYNRLLHVKTYIIGVSILVLAGLWWWLYTGEQMVLFGLSAFALLVVRPLIFYCFSPRSHFRRKPRLRDTQLLSCSEDGIELKTGNLNSQLKWQVYRQAYETPQFYLLFYGEQLFTIIPKRVFANVDQEARFRELLKRKIAGCLAEQ
jgi:hypothetical protein